MTDVSLSRNIEVFKRKHGQLAMDKASNSFPILISADLDIWISRKSKTARDVLHLVSPQPISGKGACFWHFSLDRWGAKNSLGKSKQNFGPVTQR